MISEIGDLSVADFADPFNTRKSMCPVFRLINPIKRITVQTLRVGLRADRLEMSRERMM
jgi:hypothetical protein